MLPKLPGVRRACDLTHGIASPIADRIAGRGENAVDRFGLTGCEKLKIQIGKLDPMKASVAWVKNLEENIIKLGIEITE